MRKANWDGSSFALGALLLWFGFTQARTAATAISNSGAAGESTTDSYEDLVAEMHRDSLRGFENRLAFEAWADSR